MTKLQHILLSNSAKEHLIHYSIHITLHFSAVLLCLFLMVARVLKHYITLIMLYASEYSPSCKIQY